jgi:hypothetical protein
MKRKSIPSRSRLLPISTQKVCIQSFSDDLAETTSLVGILQACLFIALDQANPMIFHRCPNGLYQLRSRLQGDDILDPNILDSEPKGRTQSFSTL